MRKLFAIVKEDLVDKKWFLIIIGVLVGLLGCYLVYMVDTLDLSGLQAYLDSVPESLKAVLGPIDVANPYSLLNAYFLNYLWLYCGVFLIYLASNLVPHEVENNTLDLVLSKPVSRLQYLASKMVFLYICTAVLMSLILILTSVGMASSNMFIAKGLYWERIWALFLATMLHFGTLTMATVLFSALFLNSKKTMVASIMTLFLMFFIGSSYSAAGTTITNPLQYFSTWYYYNPAQFFGAGNFANYFGDMFVLLGVNVGLIIASLLIFRKRDIPI